MTTKFKKTALIFAAIFAGALLFAEPAISDYQGKDSGAKIPAWLALFEKAAGTNKSGVLSHSKDTKKLYKKLGVKDDKILFYGVQTANDKEAAADSAKKQAKDLAVKNALSKAQETLDQKLEGKKAVLKQPEDILGYAKAQEFWVKKGDAYTAYSIWQITDLNYKEAAASLANSYLRENGYLPKAQESKER